MVVDDPTKALLEGFSAKIHQEPYGQFEKSKIGHHLLGMDRRKAIDGLKFDQQAILDDKVRAKARLDEQIADLARNYFLPFHYHATPPQSRMTFG